MRPVRQSGSRLYVDPDAVRIEGDHLILAGTPNYYWNGDRILADSFFAAVVDANTGSAHLIPHPPLPTPPGIRTVAPHPEGGWLAVFSDYHPSESRELRHQGIWSGVWDGTWSRLRPVPIPEAFSLRTLSKDRIDVRESDLAHWLAIVVSPRDRLLVFRLDDRGWSRMDDSVALIDQVYWVVLVDRPPDIDALYMQYPDIGRAHISEGGMAVVQPFFTWSTPVNMTRFGVSRSEGQSFVMWVDKRPILYQKADADSEAVRVPLAPGPEAYDQNLGQSDYIDAFMATLASGEAIVVSQPRRFAGGATRMSIDAIAPSGATDRLVLDSPFAALQSVIAAGDRLYFVGTVLIEDGSLPFATDLAYSTLRCEVHDRS